MREPGRSLIVGLIIAGIATVASFAVFAAGISLLGAIVGAAILVHKFPGIAEFVVGTAIVCALILFIVRRINRRDDPQQVRQPPDPP
jgi:membrane protein implicated in regulation of membrane protease activity